MVPRHLGPCTLACVALCYVPWGTSAAAQTPLVSRMVVATDVVCRAAPSRSAPVVRGYAPGDRIGTRRAVETAGETWYSDDSRASGVRPACWVFGQLTVPYDGMAPAPALLAAADHVLSRTDDVAFEDYVAVENLLLRATGGPHREEPVLASSGLLQLRRLQIIQRALATPALEPTWRRPSPLTDAWLIAHDDLIYHFDPGALWAIRPAKFWALFEQYRTAPWAEEIAWAAAGTPVHTDECDAACVLWTVNQTYAQYWAAFPQGAFVDDALLRATDRARYGASICPYGAGNRLQQELSELRESLRHVTAQGRPALITHLDAIERDCRVPPA